MNMGGKRTSSSQARHKTLMFKVYVAQITFLSIVHYIRILTNCVFLISLSRSSVVMNLLHQLSPSINEPSSLH